MCILQGFSSLATLNWVAYAPDFSTSIQSLFMYRQWIYAYLLENFHISIYMPLKYLNNILMMLNRYFLDITLTFYWNLNYIY